MHLYVNKFVVYGYRERYGKFTREPTFKNFLLIVSEYGKGVRPEGEFLVLDRGQLADLVKKCGSLILWLWRGGGGVAYLTKHRMIK